ncbi:MAG TPA: aspartate kinase [Roseiflexaceae bacterium]|nr:aspartate kinase [Roseiflexaceae bacterium]
MIVMKFGAAAASDVARLEDLTLIVGETAGIGMPVVVVCSALSGMTDALIGAARAAARGNEAAADEARRSLWGRHRTLAERLVSDEWEREILYREWADLLKVFDRITRSIGTLGEHSPRSIDAVAAIGERFMAHLIATTLRQGGQPARMIDAAELIVTDDHYGAAQPLIEPTNEQIRSRLLPLLQSRIVPVVTGYIGATESGVVTTLGRGGGDYSATLIGAAIGAEAVEIWSDVDGIMTADPKIVAGARTLDEISYAEAAEIAMLGAEVLHPRTLAPIAAEQIPLRIRNILRPDHAGTRVVAEPQPSPHAAHTIISARALALLGVQAFPVAAEWIWPPDLTQRILMRCAAAGIEVLTLTQSFSERTLTIAVRAADAEFTRDLLTDTVALERRSGLLQEVTAIKPVALVAVISTPDSDDLVAKTLASLAGARAHVLSLAHGVASSHISFTLPEREVDAVVRTLHRDLELA